MATSLGIEQTIAEWNREWNGLGRGYGRYWTASTSEGAQLVIGVTRLTDDLFLITSEARAGPARRLVTRAVRLGMSKI